MKTLYLHFGTHKTGSTSLQNFLYHHRDSLKKNGFLYPVEGTYFYSGEKSQSLFAHSLIGERPKYISTGTMWSKESCISDLKRDLNNSHCNNAIISSEHFFNIKSEDTIAEIKSIFENHFDNIKVIIYLRRQDLFYESKYNQLIKAGLTTSTFEEKVNEWLIDVNFNYNIYMELLSSVFGKASLIVRPFEESQLYMGDVISDFFKILNIKLSGNISKKSNKSIPAEMLEMIRLTNKYFSLLEHRQLFYKFLIKSGINFDTNKYTIIPPNLRKDILDFHRESNTNVAKKFLGRKDGILFHDPEISLSPFYPGLSVEKLAGVTAEIFKVKSKIN
jgi:hypothetical protein